MTRRSIRLRLLLAAAVTITAGLALAGWGLTLLFERHVERGVFDELETDALTLMSNVSVSPSGQIELGSKPRDTRYEQQFSGSYWQVFDASGPVEKSQSLWDEDLTLPATGAALGFDPLHVLPGPGPSGAPTFFYVREFTIRRHQRTYMFRFAVARDRREALAAVGEFRGELAMAMAFLAAALLVAFWITMNVGLRPLQRLRRRLAAVRGGEAARLTGTYPAELAPLVDDLNDLIERQETSLARARTRAADLAHGLKTPLTAISVLGQDLRARGDGAIAVELGRYVADMQRHVERELTLARAAYARHSKETTALDPVLWPLIKTMRRLPRGDRINWRVQAPPGVTVGFDAQALSEVLGNLLDNARKWARKLVRIRVRRLDEEVALEIEDDGPGVPPDSEDAVLQRGARLDVTKPGSGFGLTIVREIVEHNEGRIELFRSELGGFGVRISLPAPPGVKRD